MTLWIKSWRPNGHRFGADEMLRMSDAAGAAVGLG